MKGSLAIAISFLAFTGFSQNDGDIYRYSKHFHAGTARFEAMGGAFGALGADLSAGQINPAAMGRFSSSQVSLSLGPQIYVSDADFQGQLSETSRTSFSVPNFGVVFTNDISNRNKGDLVGWYIRQKIRADHCGNWMHVLHRCFLRIHNHIRNHSRGKCRKPIQNLRRNCIRDTG